MTIYETITERVLALLEEGRIPWRKPWRGGGAGMPRNFATGRPYRGINVFLLACAGYERPEWLTFHQAKQLGGTVRRGEKGFPVVFWRFYDREDESGQPRRVPVAKQYTVFNVAQCEGLALPPMDSASCAVAEPIAAAEAIVAAMPDPPIIRHGDARAWYSASADVVNVPARELFDPPEEYYSTLFHELTHATGHGKRLGRDAVTDAAMFGSHAYSREELVAEMGSAFLCAHAGIEQVTLANSAAYIAGWMAKLRGDTRLVVQAAAAAQRAADLILGTTFGGEAGIGLSVAAT